MQKTKFKQTEIGKIPEDWEVKELNDVVIKLGDGLHGTPNYDDKGDYYFINGNNLVDGKIKVNKETKKCSKEEFEKYKKELNNRTILVSINGTLGNIALYNDEKIILGKSACYINVKDEYNLLFIKYVLKNKNFQNHIQSNATGTTIKNVSLKQMREFKFGIPKNNKEQFIVSKIFSDLDAKIELNNKINKTLESIGQALFKRWFVDFEFPNEEGKSYKSSGGEMVNSELGMIPKGWKLQQLKEIGKIICGKTPPTSDKDNYGEDYPFITIPDMHKGIFIIKTERRLSKLGAETQKKKELYSLTICVSCIATPGLVSLTTEKSFTNQQINSIVCNQEINPYFTYLSMKNKSGEIKMKGMGGTTTLNLNTGNFEKIEIIVPSENMMKKFSLVITGVFNKILFNSKEAENLSKIRDSLLPKLMNGEIRVK